MTNGGLMQLAAMGAYGANYYTLLDMDCRSNMYNKGPLFSNNRDSIMYWFVDHEDGIATEKDIGDVITTPSILHHVPEMQKPKENCIIPFNITNEKSCVKIQRAWRNSISNPNYTICRKRLMREFKEGILI